MFPAVGTFKLLIGEYLQDNEKWWMSALDRPTPQLCLVDGLGK